MFIESLKLIRWFWKWPNILSNWNINYLKFISIFRLLEIIHSIIERNKYNKYAEHLPITKQIKVDYINPLSVSPGLLGAVPYANLPLQQYNPSLLQTNPKGNQWVI